uniref:Uncharacterized protein n=1 Tax=Micrurus spixii TaxID=129469 RepID=A0A2D4M3E6_9SAUR
MFWMCQYISTKISRKHLWSPMDFSITAKFNTYSLLVSNLLTVVIPFLPDYRISEKGSQKNISSKLLLGVLLKYSLSFKFFSEMNIQLHVQSVLLDERLYH